MYILRTTIRMFKSITVIKYPKYQEIYQYPTAIKWLGIFYL